MVPFAKFMPLMKYMSARLEDLTVENFDEIASVLGIEVQVTDELKNAGLALLKGENIHTVSDMIQSPESVQQLMSFITRKSAEERMVEAEIIEMYAEMPPPSATEFVSNSAQKAGDLISSPLVGWRLPG